MRSALRSVLAQLASPQDAAALLSHTDMLLDIMRLYGKQLLQQPEIIDMIKSQSPEIYHLYHLLGGHRLTKRDCLSLREKLLQLSHVMVVSSSHDVSLDIDGECIRHTVSSDPFLQVMGGGRIYRRSLQDDLTKLAHA